nr:RNA polymerase sigma factor [Noviherbaspirillum sp. UKPF54]
MMLPSEKKAVNADCSDAELAARIAAGEHGAFTLLMRRYNRRLYRTARSFIKDDAEAEDVLQDAYVLAYRSIGTFRGEAALLTWLTRIVVNEAAARLRKTARRAELFRIDGGELDLDAAEVGEGAPDRPEHAAMRAEARALIEKKIDELPAALRIVFVLRAMEELSVEEVAACLNIPQATVRTRFFRARSVLREALSREIDFAFEDAFSFAGARCNRIVAAVTDRLGNSREGGARSKLPANVLREDAS